MKKTIILAIIIIALAVAYYFVSFLPSQKLVEDEQKKQAFLFQKQSECKNICDNLYEGDKDALGDTTVFNPRYSYNENKNACFYSGGWISSDPRGTTQRIINCQTNEEVLTYTTINGEVFTSFCDTCVSTPEEYDAKEKEFIGN